MIFRQLALLFCVLFWGVGSLYAQKDDIPKTPKKSYKQATDVAQISPKPYDYTTQKKYKGIEYRSLYLTMRDSVRLAIDVYLPKSRKKDEKLPALMHQTRYWRKPQLKFPVSMFSRGLLGRTGKMIRNIVACGYAIVNVDVRGSGASFGSHPHPWTVDEVKDGAEIIDWIIKQDWADGNVGSLGASYSGTTAEFLATNQHPNLKAVALLYSLYDVFEDNAFPGGIHHTWFTESWGRANDAMDKNELPENARKYRALVGGVSLVQTKNRRELLRQAIAEHANNRNVHDGALTVDFRDDVPQDGFIKNMDVFSPHLFTQKINETKVAVYSYSGWMDGGYQNAAIKRYLNLTVPNNKLLLGPWEHGGSFNISPYAPTRAGFDHTAELLKFFDYHLKGIQNGLYDEPRIHYFTLGAERWQASNVWPPANSTLLPFYLHGDKSFNRQNPTDAEKICTHHEDNTCRSGRQSRWRALNGKIVTAQMYYDWNENAKKFLSYTGEPLAKDLEMTGHPLADLYISLSDNATDGSVFVYIEDIDEKGIAHHVTEGELRVSHRKLTEQPIYKEASEAARSHCRTDYCPVKPQEIAHLRFDLLPVSYLFQKGHRIRISIAGADIDHFEIINPQGYDINIHHSPQFPSSVSLPIVGE